MNIFHLSLCPKKSASYLCDKHVSKMFTETGQMLSAAHDRWGSWEWTYLLACELMNQHWLRFHTMHKTMWRMKHWVDPPPTMREGGFTSPPLCMPDEYHSESWVASYRMYYCKEKSHFAKWVHCTPVPFWYEAIQ